METSMRHSPPGSVLSKSQSDSPPGPSNMTGVSSQPIFNNQSYDYRSGYNGQGAGTSAAATGPLSNDPFNMGDPSRGRGGSVSGSYTGHGFGHSPSLSGDQYTASGFQSETRSTYPSVSDESIEQRLYHRTSSSHPYHREQPHISSVIKSERDTFGNSSYNDIKMPAVDPFMSDTGVASVSRLGRQVSPLH